MTSLLDIDKMNTNNSLNDTDQEWLNSYSSAHHQPHVDVHGPINETNSLYDYAQALHHSSSVHETYAYCPTSSFHHAPGYDDAQVHGDQDFDPILLDRLYYPSPAYVLYTLPVMFSAFANVKQVLFKTPKAKSCPGALPRVQQHRPCPQVTSTMHNNSPRALLHNLVSSLAMAASLSFFVF